MSVPALWTKHRPIARGIARDYRIPGMGADDASADQHKKRAIQDEEECCRRMSPGMNMHCCE